MWRLGARRERNQQTEHKIKGEEAGSAFDFRHHRTIPVQDASSFAIYPWTASNQVGCFRGTLNIFSPEERIKSDITWWRAHAAGFK